MSDREILIELIEKWNKDEFAISYASYELADYLIANNAVVQKQGEWLEAFDDYMLLDVKECGVCHCEIACNISHYCPNCGAKMKEVK